MHPRLRLALFGNGKPGMKFLPLLTLAILVGGCVAPEDFGGARKPSHNVDEFTGETTDTVHTAPIGGLTSELKAPARITLSLIRTVSKSGETNAMLRVNYKGLRPSGGWLFIEPGESLIFLIDGETIALRTTEGSARFREVGDGGVVYETAYYPFSLKLADRIASASSVKMRLKGTSSFMDKPFNEGNLKSFGDFSSRMRDQPPQSSGASMRKPSPGHH